MADSCGCHDAKTDTRDQRRVLTIALALNVTMFVIGLVAGLIAQSSGLLADALDMLADATAYGIALVAIGRSPAFKANAGLFSGSLLMILGLVVLTDAMRRGITGSSPQSMIILATATLSLIVNATVLHLLGRYKEGEAHLRATWIFTRADVIANLAVIASGLIVLGTGIRTFDLMVGAAIGIYVIHEAIEIIGEARAARKATPSSQPRTARGDEQKDAQ